MTAMTPLYVLIAINIAGLLYVGSRLKGDTSVGTDQQQKRDELIGDLKQQLEKEQAEKNEQAGKAKELFLRFKDLEADNKVLKKENDTLQKDTTKYEAEKEQNQAQQQQLVTQLDNANKALQEERERVVREDEQRRQKELEELDRMWGEHEEVVVSLMSDLCKKPQFNFSTFDNTNLPEDFSGKLKPDFMVAFLDQYVIFDAKVSKRDNLNVYIKEQVKKTATKVKGNDKIYPCIFLVVPTLAFRQIKQTHFYEEGLNFFVIAPESVAPILASLKRIESYEFAEQMDPQERENIIDLIAQFDFHINSRNAVEYFLQKHGLETLSRMKKLDQELVAEVAAKKAKIRQLNFSTADQKELVQNPELLDARLNELTNPAAQIDQEELQSAKKVMKS